MSALARVEEAQYLLESGLEVEREELLSIFDDCVAELRDEPLPDLFNDEAD